MAIEFIAEVSSNHHRDLKRCILFVEEAARIGCTAVKFQLFKIRELFSPEILAISPKHREREKWELPFEYIPEIAAACRKNGIKFSCTPFYLDAVQRLNPYVDFYKIASYELLWNDLLTACGKTGKPIVLSTGMANMEEINAAVRTIKEAGCRDLTLLHCVSGYPTPVSECNLAVIETLRKKFGCCVGWSDHSVSAGVIQRAINRWDARVIEFHLDLDGQGEEFSAGHCWLPDSMEKVIRETKSALDADGNGIKLPAPSELSDRDWRADPDDGLRPLRHIRNSWKG